MKGGSHGILVMDDKSFQLKEPYPGRVLISTYQKSERNSMSRITSRFVIVVDEINQHSIYVFFVMIQAA